MVPSGSRFIRIGYALRGLIVAIAWSVGTHDGAAANAFTKGRAMAPLTPALKPGDYVWKPEISPSGPVVIVVSITAQELLVYRNGIRIGRSTVSTGKDGHRTPTGVFTILQKRVDHESSIYKGAKMPYMQRLTWDGIAIHAGKLPGYPASAGCVRLPLDFAGKLYEVTTNGTTVIVVDSKYAPGQTRNPGLLLSGKTGSAPTRRLSPGEFEWQAENSRSGAVSVVFSTADSVVYVYRNGVQIGRSVFTLTQRGAKISGSHVYSALSQVDAKGWRSWLATTSVGGGRAPDIKALASQISIPAPYLQRVRPIISPGTTLIITDLPVSEQTRSGTDFRILTTDSGK